MAKKRFYVVWDGINPGIYSDWKSCEAQIKGYSTAKYKAFDSQEEAQRAYASNCWEYIGKNATTTKNNANWKNLPQEKQPICPSLSVDAACSGNPGKMEYRGVDTATGKEIFRVGPYEGGTNNIGEFLALVHGLALLEKTKQHNLTIYSDSRTAMAWVKKKQAATKLVRNQENGIIFELIKRAENWLLTHHYHNPIIKWDTDQWGEVPADFGRK